MRKFSLHLFFQKLVRCTFGCSVFISVIGLLSASVLALEPDEVFVLANSRVPAGIELAGFYMRSRGIPDSNFRKLHVTTDETISRSDYEGKIAAPLRKTLQQLNGTRNIRCLVLMYGLPLRVAAPEMPEAEREELETLQKTREGLEQRIEDLSPGSAMRNKLQAELDAVQRRLKQIRAADRTASLDSELSLVLKPEYPLKGWLPNPFFLGNRDRELEVHKRDVLMVGRIDGPSKKIAKRVMTDAWRAEKRGLAGTAYFDARWPEPADKRTAGYAFYDRSLHRAARRLREDGRMPVVTEATDRLFQPGECPDAALYCGWYSLAQYVDAFQWQPGAIGYHIASAECTTLKKEGSRVWCKMMLEKGAAATLGPVGEPYVQAFPIPELFFGLLVDGYLSLAECYQVSLPWLSWKMVLVGDPLYRPFKNIKSR
jgi:uncharacterized protein (TIGR03790 family)